MSDGEYYLQDSRSYVGNDVLWWAKDGNGYTTDLSKAQVYSKVDAVAQHQMREYARALSRTAPEGYVMVPKEPTPEMFAAARSYWFSLHEGAATWPCGEAMGIYNRMIAASPSIAQGGEG